MNRLLLLPLAAALLVLAAAAPAGALSGEGITVTLSAPRLGATASARSTPKTHTCQAGDTKQKVKAHSAVIGNARKTAVVACEQPPRSELIGPGLKQAAANVVAALG